MSSRCNDSSSEARRPDLERIETGLRRAGEILERFTPGRVEADEKSPGDPVTEADRTVDRELRRLLPQRGEGWLSEETRDDLRRLDCRRVWVVDPLDGTREFVAGIPEWAVSIALVEESRAVAGGIYNPATQECFLGALGLGVTLNGRSVSVSKRRGLAGATVVASRSEIKRGEWNGYREAGFTLKPTGSVAYKLALVAAGRADATWSRVRKNQWDVAAGVALVEAGGGMARWIDGGFAGFNRREARVPGLIVGPAALVEEIAGLLAGQ